MSKWQKKQIEIMTLGHVPVKCEALCRDGLAVTPIYDMTNRFSDSEYTVVHIASGCAVSLFKIYTRREAFKIANQLLPLADWTQSREKLQTKSLMKKVAKVVGATV